MDGANVVLALSQRGDLPAPGQGEKEAYDEDFIHSTRLCHELLPRCEQERMVLSRIGERPDRLHLRCSVAASATPGSSPSEFQLIDTVDTDSENVGLAFILHSTCLEVKPFRASTTVPPRDLGVVEAL
jgi:hypothetical protein